MEIQPSCTQDTVDRREAEKLAHLLECASLKKNYMNTNYEKICWGRYTALGHLVFFSNEKKINFFRLMHIALFLKVTY